MATVTYSSQTRDVCDLLTDLLRFFSMRIFFKGKNSGKHRMVNLDDLFQKISHLKGQIDIQHLYL